MKKVLGILALGLVASSVAVADQDYVKSFSWTTYSRQVYTDASDKGPGDGDKLGWAGFKGANKAGNRWENAVSTKVALEDEGDLELSLYARLRREENKAKKKGSNRANTWKTIVDLSKDYTIGNWDARWTLGWEYHQLSNNDDKDTIHLKNKGYANKFYVGPAFSVNYFGQKFDISLKGVYFNTSGVQDLDYTKTGTEGWGVDFDIANRGDILSGKYGKLGYYVSLSNSLKDGIGSGEKSSVYLDYTVGLKYSTPTYKGFSGSLNVENGFSRNTGNPKGKRNAGKTSEASAWLVVQHSSSYNTSVGKVSFTPFVYYKPWNRKTVWKENNRRTTEENEWRVGFTLGYSAK